MCNQTASVMTAMPQVSRSWPTQKRCTGCEEASFGGGESGLVAALGSRCVMSSRTLDDHTVFDAGLPISETCNAVNSAARPSGERPAWLGGFVMEVASILMMAGL